MNGRKVRDAERSSSMWEDAGVLDSRTVDKSGGMWGVKGGYGSARSIRESSSTLTCRLVDERKRDSAGMQVTEIGGETSIATLQEGQVFMARDSLTGKLMRMNVLEVYPGTASFPNMVALAPGSGQRARSSSYMPTKNAYAVFVRPEGWDEVENEEEKDPIIVTDPGNWKPSPPTKEPKEVIVVQDDGEQGNPPREVIVVQDDGAREDSIFGPGMDQLD
jgi:hypothetical protein